MSLDNAKQYLQKFGYEDRIITYDNSTAKLAYKALGIDVKKIAKTLSFMLKRDPMLIVLSGDFKINNAKFKAIFNKRASTLSPKENVSLIGYAIGEICPFGINDGVKVYLDESLKRFDYVYLACGDTNSMIKLSIEELEKCSNFEKWVDVSRG